ncbi:hypothetical protein BY996DRAFT_6448049 [Phakopsora pachyrhizi]|nr:hypothetical protein BY996DRAFT_6448049 [Phakopsora pachyrhizi]
MTNLLKDDSDTSLSQTSRTTLVNKVERVNKEKRLGKGMDGDEDEETADILMSQSYNPLNTNSINNHSSINRQPIYYSITLSPTSRPPTLQLRFITPPKTILTIELKPLRLNSLSISELVFLPVIIYNQLVRPTDRSSTRISNFHHQQLYLRQPEDGTDDDFINDEELNPDPIDPEYILGSPTSEMVRYSHPQLFITNEPES